MAMDNTIRIAPDIGSWVLFPGKTEKTIYLVGSVQADKYLAVPAEQHPLVMQILEKLRLGYLPDQIEADLKEQGLVVNVGEFCKMLARKKVIEWETADEPTLAGESPLFAKLAAQNASWATLFGHLRALSWQVFSIKLDPYQAILDKLAPMALGTLIVIAVVTSVIVALLGGISLTALRQLTLLVVNSPNVIWLTVVNMLLMPVFVFLHETAHAFAAARGRVYPRKLSFRLYLFSVPYFSLQLPGLYTLPLVTRFLAIAAGPLMDLALGNLFFLAARNSGPALAPWVAFVALGCYGRLLFNVLPILPMTDGYALLSQAVFREIDIRGHATKEFRRWRKKKPNNFRGKYIAFFVLNVSVAAVMIGAIVLELNAFAWQGLKVLGLLPVEANGWIIALLFVFDGVCLYMARGRLRMLFGG